LPRLQRPPNQLFFLLADLRLCGVQAPGQRSEKGWVLSKARGRDRAAHATAGDGGDRPARVGSAGVRATQGVRARRW
jgi:hypothetical protein